MIYGIYLGFTWDLWDETNIAPKNGWLEYDCFLLGYPILMGFFVSFREGKFIFKDFCLVINRPQEFNG